MSVSVKRPAAAIGALLLLLVVAVPIVALLLRDPLVNSDPARRQIDQLLLELTGRPVKLAGDIDIDDFPWISVIIGAGALENPAGFNGPPLLAWQEIRLRVHYSSLYSGSPMLGPVIISGLTVNLQRDAQGRDNWSDLGPLVDSGPPAAPLVIPGIELRDLALRYLDESSSAQLRVELADARLDIKDIRRGVGSIEGARWRVRSVELEGQGKVRTLGAATSQVELADRLVLRLDEIDARMPADVAPAVSVTAVEADFGVLRAALTELRWTAAMLTARFELRPAALDALLEAVGIEPPFASTPQLLQLRQLQAELQLKDGALRIQQLAAQVDETRLRGALTLGEPLELALEVDSLDLDRYASVLGTGKNVDPEIPMVFPGRLLQALPLTGRIRIGEIHGNGASLAGVTLRLESAPRNGERTVDGPAGTPRNGRPSR